MLSPDLILAKGDHLASGSRPKTQISLVRQDKAGELNLQEISAQALIQLSNSMYETRRGGERTADSSISNLKSYVSLVRLLLRQEVREPTQNSRLFAPIHQS